jgi:perosamine synthetase
MKISFLKKENKYMTNLIPHNKPNLGREEKKAAKRVLNSGWIATGPEGRAFENDLCKYVGLEEGHASLVNSGSAALYLALLSIGVGAGDEVIAPSYVCTAVLNAINLTGATPVIVDIEKETLNISFEGVRNARNTSTKAVIITHTFGIPADTEKFKELGIKIVEDCCQALGSMDNGQHVGLRGDVAVASFYASKLITSGGYGGMVYSKDKEIIAFVEDYKDFDCREEYKERFNFLLSDMQAAVGRAQLKKFSKMLKRRASISKKYDTVVPAENKFISELPKKSKKNNYRYLIEAEEEKKLIKALADNGVKAIVPIEPYELLHNYLKLEKSKFPVSEWAARNLVSIPIFPALKNNEVETVIEAIKLSVK